MAQLVVRNIEDDVKARLQRRAKRNRRSMEEEVRDILRAAVHEDESASAGRLGTEMVRLVAKAGIDFDFEFPELRGFEIKPPKFEE